MRLQRLAVRQFRNLADAVLEWPPEGVLLLGENGQGKTNLLEAAYYLVLCRALRGTADADVVRFGADGFAVEAEIATSEGVHRVGASYQCAGRRKRLTVAGAPVARAADVVGTWLAVAFLPGDVALAAGPAEERRSFLDRTLSLAEPRHLRALLRYRAALAQRNAALRMGRLDAARAFDAPLADAGAVVTAARFAWVSRMAADFAQEYEAFAGQGVATMAYRGDERLADQAAWPALLEAAQASDLAQRRTGIGPHRDELELRVGGRLLREFGSTGQQRAAALVLKLLEARTLAAARGAPPCLVLDDAFAELDGERQEWLAARLAGNAQLLVSAPRRDEAPRSLALPVWHVEGGRVRAA